MTWIADRLFALAWVIAGIVAVVAAGDISGGGANAQDALGPRLFPQAIGVILVLLGLWLLVVDPIVRRLTRPDEAAVPPPALETVASDASETATPAPPWRVPLAIATTVAYVAFLPVVHYVAATLIASVAMLALLGVRSWAVLIIFPLVLTFAAQYAFTEVVGVILP